MRFINGRLVIGLAILFIGVILLLNNLGVGINIEVSQVLKLWPVIPLVLGVNWLFLSFHVTKQEEANRKVFFSWGQFITALIAIAVGVVFLGKNLGLFTVSTALFWNIIWPVVLIIIGLNLLKGRSVEAGRAGRFVFLGGANIGGSEPWKLESGSYFAFMGGIDMDLRSAEIAEGETVLDLTAIMGGIDVKIPPNLSVIYDGSAIMGGVTFKEFEDGGIIGGRKIEQNIDDKATKVVRFQTRTIMGGVEIKE